jgi:hypothetical protein
MTPSRVLISTATALLAVFTTAHAQQPDVKKTGILSDLFVEDLPSRRINPSESTASQNG